MSWPAILLTPTNRASLSLRRLSFDLCPKKPYGMTCHDARTFIGTTEIIGTPDSWELDVVEPPHHDPRWPKQCTCGYVFKSDDYWQLNNRLLYTRSDTGEELTLRETTAGMIWHAPWLLEVHEHHAGPDGQFLVAKLPGGAEWMIDGPSTNGNGWTRMGVPPHITVVPSIMSEQYHGFLRSGVFTDDLEGRKYADA
jgi:hypothetical protein